MIELRPGRDAVHLVGLGGAGMSALARILVARGIRVSGSDLKESRALKGLRALGVRTGVGHAAEHLGDATLVVASSAIPATNPEIVAARAAAVPVLQRAQLLAMLMRDRKGIAVAGTHGKTTTTSMIATVLRHAGLDPTFVIGGDLNETGTNAHEGGGEWIVAEADESDGSFLWLAPDVAVVTNVEADHLDYYRDLAEIRAAFAAFCSGIRPGGSLVVCADDPGSAALAASSSAGAVTYGLVEGADWRAEVTERSRDGVHATIVRAGRPVGEMRLAVAGDHNVRNALAAIAVADLAGVDVETAAAALAVFGGVARRFEMRGVAAGVTVVDDYAHHPTEVRAALAGARDRGWSRIIAVFQPHRFSRTAALGRDLGSALAAADVAVVTDVYAAGETPIPGVTGKVVVDGLLDSAASARAVYLPARRDVAAFVASRAKPGDLVMTIGAGDVTQIAGEILDALGGSPRVTDARDAMIP